MYCISKQRTVFIDEDRTSEGICFVSNIVEWSSARYAIWILSLISWNIHDYIPMVCFDYMNISLVLCILRVYLSPPDDRARDLPEPNNMQYLKSMSTPKHVTTKYKSSGVGPTPRQPPSKEIANGEVYARMAKRTSSIEPHRLHCIMYRLCICYATVAMIIDMLSHFSVNHLIYTLSTPCSPHI